jgi:hypothetical protein
LRTPQRQVSVDADQYKTGQHSDAADEMMYLQRL